MKLEINLNGLELSDCIALLNLYISENSGIMAIKSIKKLKAELEK
jgi:hypothetical protein